MTAPPPYSPSPAPSPGPTIYETTSIILNQSRPSKSPIDFSPPLITMVVVAAAAFIIVTYSRLISRYLFPPFLHLLHRYKRWRHRRRHFPPSDVESLPPLYESSDGFFVYSPYGLDETVIKNIPLTIYKLPKSTKSSSSLGFYDDEFNDCAVCLLEFEVGDYIRTLPYCSHSFHVDCIDIWLRSHATCPLCRAGVFIESPLTPLMASRIRPSLDDGLLLESMFLEPLTEVSNEIQPERSSDLFSPSEDHHRSNRRELDFLLKRSYSFGFERSFASERIVLEAATTPYHHHRHHRRRSFLSTKRPSSTPFSSIAKSRIFSFRNYRTAMKSPAFFRRRNFLPLSESSGSLRYNGAEGSSRRSKFPMSPIVGRSPVTAIFSSSRMRCGDPEALLSPER